MATLCNSFLGRLTSLFRPGAERPLRENERAGAPPGGAAHGAKPAVRQIDDPSALAGGAAHLAALLAREVDSSPARFEHRAIGPPMIDAPVVDDRVIDNRVFLLGLDELYRRAVRRHEVDELLQCARRVAKELRVGPATVPVEGYYAEEPKLTEYFLLMRRLQAIDAAELPTVGSLPEFQRLLQVTSAPLYGHPQTIGKLLPVGRDALTLAMRDTPPGQWTSTRLTAAAYMKAAEADDFSLVGLAARARDTVVLTALRESVVLYAEALLLTASSPPRPPRYVWLVDEELTRQARRFIDTFNALFDEHLPAPEAASAEAYWHAFRANHILGRCIRLGCDDSTAPTRHYHWAIYRSSSAGGLAIQEFWQPEIWTTARYRSRAGRGSIGSLRIP